MFKAISKEILESLKWDGLSISVETMEQRLKEYAEHISDAYKKSVYTELFRQRYEQHKADTETDGEVVKELTEKDFAKMGLKMLTQAHYDSSIREALLDIECEIFDMEMIEE